MGYRLNTHDKKLISWLQKNPALGDPSLTWQKEIQEKGITPELTDLMQSRVSELGANQRTKLQAELTMLIRQWRLEQQSRHFRRR